VCFSGQFAKVAKFLQVRVQGIVFAHKAKLVGLDIRSMYPQPKPAKGIKIGLSARITQRVNPQGRRQDRPDEGSQILTQGGIHERFSKHLHVSRR
jgi:hypothetical protein